jgi:hypothetical protein
MDIQQPAAFDLGLEDRQVVALEELDELVVSAP